MRKKTDKQNPITDVTTPFLLVDDLIKSDNNIPPAFKTRLLKLFHRNQVHFLVQLLSLDEKTLAKDMHGFGSGKLATILSETLARRGYKLGQLQEYQTELEYRRPRTGFSFDISAAEASKYGGGYAMFPRYFDQREVNAITRTIKALYPDDFDFVAHSTELDILEIEKVRPEDIAETVLKALTSPSSSKRREYGLSGVEGLSEPFVQAFISGHPEIIAAFSKAFAEAANTANRDKNLYRKDITAGFEAD